MFLFNCFNVNGKQNRTKLKKGKAIVQLKFSSLIQLRKIRPFHH